MRTLLTLARMACLMAWTLLMSLVVPLGFLLGERLGHRAHRTWGRGACLIVGISITWHGLEHLSGRAAVVLAPNHESIADIPVLASLPFPFKWISKQELGRIPFVGWAMRAMGTFFVRRDRSANDLTVMRSVEDGLRSGRSVVIFPEGTRTRTGDLLPFKKGAFRTAQNAGVPLIPVAISGTRKIAQPGRLPRIGGNLVSVRLGAPLDVPPGDLAGPMKEFKNRLESLLSEDRTDPSTPT